MVTSAQLLRTAIDGLLPLDTRVLVATSSVVDPAELGELPDRVVALPWVPQPEALAHAAVVVHHGGHGTTLGALAAGLPQLILPAEGDGFSNAPAVTAAGAGRLLIGEDVSAAGVRAEVHTLLTDTAHRDAARAIADEIAALPDPAATVARFAEFTA
ncbi:glycosyltransferase [Streptomyces diastatochromogenes]|nr:glycosyltransferase [Streptomyces diastatochromogenes]